LLLEGSPTLSEFTTLPCTRVVRTTSGEYAFDAGFVPPILSLRASPFLLAELQRLLDNLAARKAALLRLRPTRDGAHAAQRWAASVVGSFLPRIADLLQQRHSHPLGAYRVLAELLGALGAFTHEGQASIAAFDFANLGTTFSELFVNLSLVLDALGAEHHRRIPLRRYDNTALRAELKEPAIFRNEFYLGVTGTDPEALRSSVPAYLKIAAWNDLSAVVRSAVGGVPLQLTPRPPATLPENAGVVYFRLEKTGAFSNIFKTGELGVYHAPGLSFTDLALFAVEPDAA
jgi:type VI secretion system protein ImpJ